MARPVRIEYPGAVYHVICRGNNRQAIFRDEQDRIRYLEKLSFYCRDKSVDLLSYCLLGIARRHSDVGLGELARYLQVKELSTPSHAVRRAEERMKNDLGFARQLRRVLKILDHSSIQA
jgi:hypothetical protein